MSHPSVAEHFTAEFKNTSQIIIIFLKEFWFLLDEGKEISLVTFTKRSTLLTFISRTSRPEVTW